MSQFIRIVHILVSLMLLLLILLQTGKGGLTPFLSRGGERFRTKRGMERVFFIATIILAVLFALTSIGNLLIS